MVQKYQRLRRIIKAGGGGEFRGVMLVPAIPASSRSFVGKPAYYLVYFDSTRTGSTMAMKMGGITKQAVTDHLIESNKRFDLPNPEIF